MKLYLGEVLTCPAVYSNVTLEQLEKVIAKWHKTKNLSFDKMVSIFFHYMKHYNIYSENNVTLSNLNSNVFYFNRFHHHGCDLSSHQEALKALNILDQYRTLSTNFEYFDVTGKFSIDEKSIRGKLNSNFSLKEKARSRLFLTFQNFLYLDHDLDKFKNSILKIDEFYLNDFISNRLFFSVDCYSQQEVNNLKQYFSKNV